MRYFEFIKLLIILLIVMIGNQSIYGQGVSLGIKGGGNLSTVNMETATYKPGYQVGGFSKLMISRKLGIQVEALYSNQNSKINNEVVSLNYFSIPLLVRYNINNFLNLHAGPQYSMLMESIDPKESINGTLQKKNTCLALGIGFDMPMGFSTSLRFLTRFDTVIDGTGDISSDVVQLSMSFTLLDFKKHQLKR